MSTTKAIHPEDANNKAEASAAILGAQARQIHLRAGAAFWEERALQLQVVVLQKDAEIAELRIRIKTIAGDTPTKKEA